MGAAGEEGYRYDGARDHSGDADGNGGGGNAELLAAWDAGLSPLSLSRRRRAGDDITNLAADTNALPPLAQQDPSQ